MDKHTPGPWFVSQSPDTVSTAKSVALALDELFDGRQTDAEAAWEGRWEELVTQSERVIRALSGGFARCHCGQPATCAGAYDGIVDVACEECCGHGNEDGWCTPIVRAAGAEGAPDARLIAAAPDMLEALRIAEREIECELDNYATGDIRDTLEKVRAAIAKAEGR